MNLHSCPHTAGLTQHMDTEVRLLCCFFQYDPPTHTHNHTPTHHTRITGEENPPPPRPTPHLFQYTHHLKNPLTTQLHATHTHTHTHTHTYHLPAPRMTASTTPTKAGSMALERLNGIASARRWAQSK